MLSCVAMASRTRATHNRQMELHRFDMAPLGTALRLTPAQRAEVQAILRRHLPHVQAWVFGSRATGRARPFSDLDILLTQPASLTWDQRARLRAEFEASELPFTVDLLEAQQLKGEFAERVKAEMQSLTDG